VTSGAVHHLLEASAEAHPTRTAVVDGGRALTYEELEAQANRVARLLLELGVERGDRVGLYLDKSIEAVVGLYGALKAGAAYVPLDPAAPVARLGYIAGNCGLRVLLTGASKADSWDGLVEAGAAPEAIVVLDHDAGTGRRRMVGRREIEARDDAPVGVPADGSDLAYILYTSGSTGEPKGVMLSHGNAMAFVGWAGDLVEVGPDDRLSSHAPFHFDLSVFDLFAAARGGASVSLVPPEASVLPRELRRFIGEARITVWYSVPSILTALAVRGGVQEGDFPDLRSVIFAGEVFPTRFLRALMERLPHAVFYNWYGPTETNVCTWYRVLELPEHTTDPVPIGRAIDNTEVFAVTDGATRAGPGEVGELYVRGDTVMQGYWADPDRTARVLVPDPLDPARGGPVYRTGDLVLESEEGNLRFLGRRDSQIKSRGYRIELGEIEAAILSHPGVVECAVVAVADEEVTNRIRAHVVVHEDLTVAELARHCRAHLPKYMMPEVFDFTEALPKTSTGKIDRQALTGTGS
jgi:amino acid adenylation domain-containing protein